MGTMSINGSLRWLFVVVTTNFLVQLPYYYHQYYAKYHVLPSLPAVLLVGAVLIWFLTAYYWLQKGRAVGYYFTMAFLIVEFLFYLQTQIMQLISGHGILLYVINPHDVILFIVFGVGYLNFFAAGWFVYYIHLHKALILEKNP